MIGPESQKILEIFYVIDCWKMHFTKRVKVSSQSHSATRLTNEKCSSNKKQLIRTKKNYLVETIVFNLQRVLHNSTTNAIANLIYLANTPNPKFIMRHLQWNQTASFLPLAHWSHRKKTTCVMYCKWRGALRRNMNNQVCISLH